MKLTLRDKHMLRSMLSDACAYDCANRIERRTAGYERVLAKIIPRGRLPGLPKPRKVKR